MAHEVVNEPLQCHIRDNVNKNEVDSIHKNICSGLQCIQHTSGHHYCIFHLPVKDKRADFGSAFEQKLKSVKAALEEIETVPLSPDEIGKMKEKVSYDFRYVYFPSAVELSKYIFDARTQFNKAIFTEPVDFVRATFIEPAVFDEVVFEEAYFRGATFFQDASFVSATFNRFINFTQATFTHDVSFLDATFASLCDFSGAIFAQRTVFRSARFLDSSEVFFVSDRSPKGRPTVRFCGEVDFQYASLAGFIDFRGKQDDDVFLDRKAVSESLSAMYMKLSGRGFSSPAADPGMMDQEAVLDLQNVRLETPGRVSFHSLRLRPSWFINTDSRKLIFTTVNWENLNQGFSDSNVLDEIASLKRRGVTEALGLLEISCRHLSVNAEENSRYREASSFRRLAMELEWRAKKGQLFRGSRIKGPARDKSKRVFGFLRSCGEFAMHGLYRLTSHYGESWVRAAIILLVLVLAIFPIAYSRTAFLVCPVNKVNASQSPHPCEDRRLSFSEGIRHSLATATLQNIDIRKPNSPASETLTIFERVFGPIQAALLALAIRRRFMR